MTRRKPTAFAVWRASHPELKVPGIAKSLGVTVNTVYTLLSGRSQPRLELAVRIETLTAGAVPAAAMVRKAKR